MTPPVRFRRVSRRALYLLLASAVATTFWSCDERPPDESTVEHDAGEAVEGPRGGRSAADGSDEGSPSFVEPVTDIDRQVEWLVSLPFREGTAPSAASSFSASGEGRLLAADFQERRVAAWEERAGTLEALGGITLPGAPPTAARWLPDGRLLVSTLEGELVRLDGDASREESRRETSLTRMWDAVPLGEDEVLVVGRSLAPLGPLLHRWDAGRRRLVGSFFRPPVPDDYLFAATVAGRPAVARRADTLAAVFSLSDSVSLLTIDGAVLRRFPIRPGEYQVAADVPVGGEPEMLSDWVQDAWFVMDVFWLASGTLLVQTGRSGGAAGFRTALLGLTPNGRVLFDFAEAPRLAAVAGDRLYFLEMGEGGRPTGLRVARLRR